MPMIWTPEAEAKLCGLIIQVCEVKPTEAQKAEIAARMGSDCTAKALSHRIAHIIRKALANDNGSSTLALALATPAPAATVPKKVSQKKKKTNKAKKAAEAVPEDEKEDKEAQPEDPPTLAAVPGGLKTPPSSSVKKSLKRKASNENLLNDGKEIALGEDVGQGFRKTAKTASVEDSDDDGDDEDDEDDDGLLG